ncbi:MAG: Clp protease [Dermatophilaceae bacterium]|nr:Clp protease [Dermatophilaceae bacterium]
MRKGSALTDITTINALLTGAENEARQCGQVVPGAEHLLISALALPDGTARRTFERVGADPDQFHKAISALRVAALCSLGHGSADSTAPASALPPATTTAQGAFQVAVRLSKATKPSQLLGGHVILAICQMEQGSSAQALSTMGIDRAMLRAAAYEELGAKS